MPNTLRPPTTPERALDMGSRFHSYATNQPIKYFTLECHSVEERIVALRAREPERWAQIERLGLGPTEEEMAELETPLPIEMFDEDWTRE